MKKLAFLLLLAVAIIGMALAPATIPPANIKGFADTRYPVWDTLTTLVSSSGSVTKSTTIPGNKDLVGIEVRVQKLSGAVKGWIEHQVSIDTGASYVTISSQALSDTTIKSYYISYNYNPGYYHRLKVTDTGVQSSRIAVWKITRD